jgi:hypothetical protein
MTEKQPIKRGDTQVATQTTGIKEETWLKEIAKVEISGVAKVRVIFEKKPYLRIESSPLELLPIQFNSVSDIAEKFRTVDNKKGLSSPIGVRFLTQEGG